MNYQHKFCVANAEIVSMFSLLTLCDGPLFAGSRDGEHRPEGPDVSAVHG